MCDYISWIAKGDEVLFLTGDDVFNTKRGRELQKYCISQNDLTGHGAIRWYFGKDDKPLEGGKERECTDFSTPDNFPKIIVKAIKRGEMWGFKDGTPARLLTAPALAEYQKVTAPAEAEYQKVRDAAEAEYQKVTAAALAEYKKVRDAALAEYQKVTAAALAEYQKVTAPALAEYKKVRDAAEAEYQKVTAAALAEYKKVTAPAEAEYQKVTDAAFWTLFADVNNRNPKWR